MIKREKFTLVVFLVTFISYNILGYALNIDALKILTIHKEGSLIGIESGFNMSFGISFIALFLPVVTSYLSYYINKYFKVISE